MLLGLLEHKRRFEFNPLMPEKIEQVHAKAKEIMLHRENPTQFLYDWFTEMIEPYANVEKVFFH